MTCWVAAEVFWVIRALNKLCVQLCQGLVRTIHSEQIKITKCGDASIPQNQMLMLFDPCTIYNRGHSKIQPSPNEHWTNYSFSDLLNPDGSLLAARERPPAGWQRVTWGCAGEGGVRGDKAHVNLPRGLRHLRLRVWWILYVYYLASTGLYPVQCPSRPPPATSQSRCWRRGTRSSRRSSPSRPPPASQSITSSTSA